MAASHVCEWRPVPRILRSAYSSQINLLVNRDTATMSKPLLAFPMNLNPPVLGSPREAVIQIIARTAELAQAGVLSLSIFSFFFCLCPARTACGSVMNLNLTPLDPGVSEKVQ